jgi:hypothetical protein
MSEDYSQLANSNKQDFTNEKEELFKIIKGLSEKNITRLLYFARGLSKNGS